MTDLSRQSSAQEVIDHLRTLGSEESRQGMQRYGIRIDNALGISHGVQKQIAKTIDRDHARAFELWASGITEAQFIASQTADPKLMTREDARRWAATFNSWDMVDGVADLFVDMDDWQALIAEFAADDREFVRRTAFAMICWAVVHRKKEPDATFIGYLPLIETHAVDGRNFVKKAVNWALRTVGKRSWTLYTPALAAAQRLASGADASSRWVGRNAAHELTAAKTLAMLERRLGAPPAA